MSEELISKATQQASSNIIFQILMRCLTFIFNAFILQFIDAYTLGVINVRLLLLYTTIQFISREPTRRICLSEAKSQPWTSLINIIWLNIPISLIIGSLLSYLWTYWLSSPDEVLIPFYSTAVMIIPVAVCIEMAAESFFIYGQLLGIIRLRIYIEGFSLLIRCFVMATFIWYGYDAVKTFAYSLLFSSVLYTILYHLYFLKRNEYSRLLPSRKASLMQRGLFSLYQGFFRQTLLKQLLTEGEKFVMTFWNPLSFEEQGIYDVVNNLSSLAARFVFAPIEESAYLLFSSLLDRKPAALQDQHKYKLAMETLRDIVRLMILLGFIIIIFGFNYARLGLIIYNKRNLGNMRAVNLMRSQCFYVGLIALNGILECFVFSVMGAKELEIYNIWLISFSAIYLGSALLGSKLGGLGLVGANAINMLCRTLYSIMFISKYKQDEKSNNILKDAAPSSQLIIPAMIIFIIAFLSETNFCCDNFIFSGLHLIIGFCLFLTGLFLIKKVQPESIKLIENIGFIKRLIGKKD